jgi:hypothetical protein
MFMPSTPADAKFFTEEERVVALARMHADAHGATKEQDVNKETFDWHWVRMALLSPNTIFCSLAWFFLLIPLYVSFVSLSRNVMTLTQPVILIVPADHHQRNGILECEGTTGKLVRCIWNQLLTGVVYRPTQYVRLLRRSDHSSSKRSAQDERSFHDRSLHSSNHWVCNVAGSRKVYGSLGRDLPGCSSLCWISNGTTSCVPFEYVLTLQVMGWLSNNTAPHFVRATATGFEIAFANCAAFVATFIYLPTDAPDYKLGHSINIGALILCIVTVSCGITYCKWENAKRNSGARDHRLTDEDPARLGHRHPHFRYTI